MATEAQEERKCHRKYVAIAGERPWASVRSSAPHTCLGVQLREYGFKGGQRRVCVWVPACNVWLFFVARRFENSGCDPIVSAQPKLGHGHGAAKCVVN